jgi:ferritin-like metal-binding protein YciE
MSEHDYNHLLINWLKSAYAMENSVVRMLDNQAERASLFPQVATRLSDHREESQRHANMIEGCIKRLGGDVSQVRKGMSKMMAELQSKFLDAYDDTIVRDAIVGAATEQFEIASYKAIIALAEKLGDQETINVCQEILEEEEEMYHFLNDHLQELVGESYERDVLTT